MNRDISQKQYLAGLARHGITSGRMPIFGYITMPDGTQVSALNGGRTLRSKLAYLIARAEECSYEKLVRRNHMTACIAALYAGRPFSSMAAEEIKR